MTAALAVLAFATASASASTHQVTIMEDNAALAKNPMGTLEKMKAMGVTYVKYVVNWRYMLVDQTSTTAPAGANTAAYYDARFGFLQELDADAVKVGLKVQFLVSSPAPRWAEGPTLTGCSTSAIADGVCRPNATYFGIFVAALGAYFNGSVANVPAVRSWAFYNEPNYIINIAPQLSGTTYDSADIYRQLIDAAWTGLKATGHTTATDSILFGELAPRGVATTKASEQGDGIGIKPVAFMAALYCVTTSGKRFTGKTATANDCPSSASAFRSENPILFNASGVSDHPYSQGVAPNIRTADCNVDGETACASGSGRPADPLWTDLAGISNLENGIDKDTRAEGQEKKFAIWNTEYGYWVNPPGPAKYHCKKSYQADCDASVANAEKYLNQAEYISYHNPRIASFDQYQLYMPTDLTDSAWSNGLLTPAGGTEPTYGAWELPLWMPTVALKKPGNVTVWGGARPAAYEYAAAKVAPQVKIQFKGTSGGWSTLKTVTVSKTNPGGYFTTSVKLSKSGSVRLLYAAGKTSLTGRVQAVTVK